MMGMPVIFILTSYFIYKWGYKLKGAFLKDIVQTLENRKNREKSV
ncbi:hypothetical protein SSCHL_0086 [Staphylococcus schleiferi]|nr:hypothetical protein SSCHL_0086 [Staphylococcus schleiferi]